MAVGALFDIAPGTHRVGARGAEGLPTVTSIATPLPETEMQRAPRQHARGVSLVESMITLAVTAVTLGTVVPGFGDMHDRRRLEGAAAQIETELQYARSLAVEQRQTVRMSFHGEAGHSCYVVHTGGPGDCRCDQGEAREAVCEGDARALRTAHFEAATGLRLSSNAASIGFDAVKGTVTPTATLQLANAHDDRLRLVVNIMGRVRACTPTGLAGYKAC
jgi:type IV fimbrial biogenesis protein FimT